jgi:hydrogenase nickel incorporation protein HypA/HybF
MHEMPIAENIFRIVEQQKILNNLKKVYKINLKVGKLTTVVPACLEFCFQVISKGTEFENVKLEIEIVPFRIKCKKCEKEKEISNFFLLCPECGSQEIEILSGRELSIESIEGE